MQTTVSPFSTDSEKVQDGGGNNLCCFPEGTSVLLANGSSRAIELIRPGDQVMGVRATDLVPAVVEEVQAPIRDHLCLLRFDDRTTLRLTSEHPVATTAGWRSVSPSSTARDNPNLIVDRLDVGDRVLVADGSNKVLMAIEYLSGRVSTYNLSRLSNECVGFVAADNFRVHSKAS